MLVIKPSGVPNDRLRPEDMVTVSLDDGSVAAGHLRPSSDNPDPLAPLPALRLDRRRRPHPLIAAVSWAQAGRTIPALGTAHAGHFHGPVPVTRPLTRSEVEGDYERETGEVIAATIEILGLDPLEVPAILVEGHGPFTSGSDADGAAETATALEAEAAMAAGTLALNPDAAPVGRYILARHYNRKHGPGAYYGQWRDGAKEAAAHTTPRLKVIVTPGE